MKSLTDINAKAMKSQKVSFFDRARHQSSLGQSNPKRSAPLQWGNSTSKFNHDFSQVRTSSDLKSPEATENIVLNSPASVLPSTVPVGTPAPAPPLGSVAISISAIRGSDSPPSIKDRIPPRVDTPVTVKVKGWIVPMNDIVLSIEGSGASAGAATIDGGATSNITSDAVVQLRGVDQTVPGSGGKLKLVAHQGGAKLAESSGFSVSSIPQNYGDTFSSLLTGDSRGFVVQDSWESDSGVVADLDKAMISEQVEVTKEEGCFSGARKSNSGYLSASVFSTDTHGTPVSVMTSPGLRIAQQTCMFKDDRSSSVDIPMTKSGYTITRTVTAKPSGGRELETKKLGAATTANGVSSSAGSGSIIKKQTV